MNRKSKIQSQIFWTAATIATISLWPIRPATATNFTAREKLPSANVNESLYASRINRWYYEGCLTGCGRGYMVGYLIGSSQTKEARQKDPGMISLTTAAWPQGNITREIQTELDEILSNEKQSQVNGQYPHPLPRVIATVEQLPIRHAGIYTTFHAAVHDGFRAGHADVKSNWSYRTNAYLQLYALNHKPDLQSDVAKEILHKHLLYPIE